MVCTDAMDSMVDTSYANELIRIGSFNGWPGFDKNSKTVKPNSIDLARTGFYFTGISDEVSFEHRSDFLIKHFHFKTIHKKIFI